MKIHKEPDSEICAYCGDVAEGNYAIHRDGFGIGPEVPLCDGCGSEETPTCEQIWHRIRRRMVGADLVGLQGPIQLGNALAQVQSNVDYLSKRLIEASGRDDVEVVAFEKKGMHFIKLVDADGNTVLPDGDNPDAPWVSKVETNGKG